MIVGCYTLHLYCDAVADNGGPLVHPRGAEVNYVSQHEGEFTGRTDRDCRRLARKAGWTFTKRNGQELVFCRYHPKGAPRASQ